MKVIDLIITLILLGLSLSFAEDKLLQESLVYQQISKKYQDSKGDLHLLVATDFILYDQTWKYTLENLSGQHGRTAKEIEELKRKGVFHFPQYTHPLDKFETYVQNFTVENSSHCPEVLEGRKRPIILTNFILMLKQVMTDEYVKKQINPKIGKIHTWSEESLSSLRWKYPFLSRLNKMLVAFSMGSSSRFMLTELEMPLAEYIVSRPFRSISIKEMFQKAYQLARGDVYLALLTIENILSRFWLTPEREKLILTTRLKDITNYNYKTDKYGAWYHLFGMLTYSLVYGKTESILVAGIESITDKMMTGDLFDFQENRVNFIGARTGAALREFVLNKEYLHFQRNEQYLRESFYMDLNEDFGQRIVCKK